MSKDTPVPQAESDEPAGPDTKNAKDKKGKKGKGGKAAGRNTRASGGVSIASHPRARAGVRRAKGWGGLAGFAIAAYVSFSAGIPMPMVALRAVAVGIAAYMVAWACAVTVWRHLVLAELRAMTEQHEARAAAAGADAADDKPIPKPVG
jgi:hypothetical protein